MVSDQQVAAAGEEEDPMAIGLSPVEGLTDLVDARRPDEELRRPADTERGEGRERNVVLDGERHGLGL